MVDGLEASGLSLKIEFSGVDKEAVEGVDDEPDPDPECVLLLFACPCPRRCRNAEIERSFSFERLNSFASGFRPFFSCAFACLSLYELNQPDRRVAIPAVASA